MASTTMNLNALSLKVHGSTLNKQSQGKRTQAVAPAVSRRNRLMCKATDEEKNTTSMDTSSESTFATQAPMSTTAQDGDVVTSILKVFKSGQASETLNGRAAMIGFTAAMVNEFSSGDSMLSQVIKFREVVTGYGTREIFMPQVGLILIPATVAVVLLASFFPELRGQSDNGLDKKAKPFAFFTPEKETINGRAAMMGLLALYVVEGVSGAAFF